MESELIWTWVWFWVSSLGLIAWSIVDIVWVYSIARRLLREGRLDEAVVLRLMSFALFAICCFGVGWFGISLFDMYDLKLIWPF